MHRPARLLLVALLAAPVAAQDKPKPPPDEVQPVEPGADWPAQTWRMPETEVIGETPSDLREEERIGSYRQPRWTAHRRFPTTRIYVIPDGEIELEYWLRIDEPKHGNDTKIRNFYEVEIGLPWRFQFDFYVRSIHTGDWKPIDETERAYELRYAFADWGEIWGNPAVYWEVVDRQRGADKLEAKILLGDEWSEGWHWGSNLVWEKETGDAHEREFEFTAAVSHTLQDERLSLGGELKMSQLTDDTSAVHRHEYYVGPSLQWRPSPRTHFDFAPLAGFGPDSGAYSIFFVFGWEF